MESRLPGGFLTLGGRCFKAKLLRELGEVGGDLVNPLLACLLLAVKSGLNKFFDFDATRDLSALSERS